MNRPVRARFSDFEITPGETAFTVSGRVESGTPVYAVVGYLDPDGGSDYDARTVTAIPNRDGKFTLDCNALVKDRNAALNIVACHVNGAVSRHSIRYSVNKEGAPDLTTARMHLALRPLIDAVNAGDKDAAFASMESVHANAPDEPGGRTHRIAKRLIASMAGGRAFPAPGEIGEGTKEVPLGDCTPASAKVGWHRPFFDRTPPPSTVLGAGGRLFEHGIYAHAPAAHRFALGKKWKTLKGNCGLSDGSRGSVVFVISGDGKELWRSKQTKAGTLREFEIAIGDAEKLVLSVEDAGDGNGSDWGLWLEPTLSR